MADKVSSWLLPDSLLGRMSPEDAQNAASQANQAFWWNLIGTGNPGTAFNAAQTQGFNAVNQGITLQQHQMQMGEAARKAAEVKIRQEAMRGAFEPGPNTGSFTAPGVRLGEGGMGPSYDPMFNQKKFGLELAKRGIATNEDIKMASPEMKLFNGIAVDPNNVASGTYFPNYDKGTMPQRINPQTGAPEGVQLMPGQLDAAAALATVDKAVANRFNQPQGVIVTGFDPVTGKVTVQNAQGLTEAISAQELAKRAAEARMRESKVYDPKSRTWVPKSSYDVMYPKEGQGGLAEAPPQDVTAGQEGGKSFNTYMDSIETNAGTARDQITNARLLASIADKFESGPFANFSKEASQYLRAAGLSSEKADQLASNVELFNTFRADKLKSDIKMLPGAASNKDVDVLLNKIGASSQKPGFVNKFYSAAEIAIAERNQQIAEAARNYDGPPSRRDFQKWLEQQPFAKQPLLAHPAFQELQYNGQALIKVSPKDPNVIKIPSLGNVIMRLK